MITYTPLLGEFSRYVVLCKKYRCSDSNAWGSWKSQRHLWN